MLKERFYKSNEEVTLRFYQMPKILFTNPKYRGLSLGAKAMYSVLRDRLDLSIKNNWLDDDGYVYLNFKTEPAKNDDRSIDEKNFDELSLTELLGINKNTVTTYKKELKKYDLMLEKKVGQGRPSMIYVLKPELIDKNNDTYQTPKKQESRILVDEGVENTETPKKQESRILDNGNQDSQNLTGNDTDFSDTDFSETFFLSPDGNGNKEISVDHLKDERKKESNNKPINEFNQILKNCNYEVYNDKLTILQAIRILYYSDKPLQIGNMSIPPSQVREDLKLLNMDHLDYALSDYEVQSKEQIIRNPTGYLAMCIYNAIFQGDFKIKSNINRGGF